MHRITRDRKTYSYAHHQGDGKMKHFKLINDINYDSGVKKAKFYRRLENREFNLEEEERKADAAICVCSHGIDECWHCGRGSKP